MNDEEWPADQHEVHQRMAKFGATPLLSVTNRNGSVLLSHADFDAYEGAYEKGPFLRLHLCTAHVGRIYREGADGSRLEGVLRPGTFGMTLPNAGAEGFWPRTQALAIMIRADQLSDIDEDGISPDALAPAASTLHRDPLVGSVMSAMWRDAEAHGLTSAFFDHGLALILGRLGEFKRARENAHVRPAKPLSKTSLDRVQGLVESRLATDVRMIELAAVCDQDIRSFTRSFRASTGFAPFEYLTMRRMENAKQLLLGSISVTEVAYSVGYSNPSKFAAAFRRYCGCTPSRWRREHR